jgi:thioredoxin-related protein
VGCAAVLALPAATVRAQAPKLGEDGLYHQPWFLESFLDLRDDFRAAEAAGKSFIVLWELRNCPYCKLLHTVNFAHPEIAAYAKANFDILQLNLVGSRPVTDFSGAELPEKALAQKFEVDSTPTLQFFMAHQPESAIEAGRVQYMKPGEFLQMLRFVRAKAYETTLFDIWLKDNPPTI